MKIRGVLIVVLLTISGLAATVTTRGDTDYTKYREKIAFQKVWEKAESNAEFQKDISQQVHFVRVPVGQPDGRRVTCYVLACRVHPRADYLLEISIVDSYDAKKKLQHPEDGERERYICTNPTQYLQATPFTVDDLKNSKEVVPPDPVELRQKLEGAARIWGISVDQMQAAKKWGLFVRFIWKDPGSATFYKAEVAYSLDQAVKVDG